MRLLLGLCWGFICGVGLCLLTFLATAPDTTPAFREPNCTVIASYLTRPRHR